MTARSIASPSKEQAAVADEISRNIKQVTEQSVQRAEKTEEKLNAVKKDRYKEFECYYKKS